VSHKLPVESELSRDLSLFHVTMMGLGMMIGAGIFLGVGNSIYHAGPGGALLTFALGGVLAICTAMSYAELSSAIPRAGGAYNFARVGFGRGTSFLAGWMEWFASSVAGSMYAVTFAIYVMRFKRAVGVLDWVLETFGLTTIPQQVASLPRLVELGVPEWVVRAQAVNAAARLDHIEFAGAKVVALLVAGLFLYINYRGASETGKVGAFITLGQTLFMLVIAVIGVVVVVGEPSRLANFQPFLPRGWGVLLVTVGFTSVAFEGYEVIAQAGDETIAPRQNLPKAMLYSVFIVTLTYVGVAFATMVAVKAGSPGVEGEPWVWIGSFREKGFGEAVSRLMPAANVLLTLAVVFASTSALNATIYSATRASYALGRDRMLPGFFAHISRARKTPWVALLFTGLIVATVATALPTMDVASSASIMFLLLFLLVNLCVIKIRRNMGDELTYGFIMPLFPILPILAICAQGVLAIELRHVSAAAWVIAPLWIGSGIVLYHLYSRTRAVATEDEIHVLEETEAPVEGDQYRVMVAVANPKNVLDMVLNTQRLCGAKDASVELLHMVPVPDPVPLSDAERYMGEGREAIVEAMLYLAPQFPISTHIRYCRSVARGIVSGVREKKADLLVMGWHGRPRQSLFQLGSTVDPIIERTPCNVVIFKDCRDRAYRRVLVPVAGGPNGAFALEIASILADPDEGRVTAFTVATGRRAFDVGSFVAEHLDRMALPQDRVESRVVNSRDVPGGILAEAEDYDLIVLGATRRPLLRQLGRDSVPETVARRCEKPLVMVKASAGIRSWVKRWI
jgi:amino acid transporter/nucleotide-binding universal stress UspA family protein